MAIPSLAMIPSGYKDGKVYSVLPSNGDGDFTFSRGSNATRVNKDGLIETVTGDTPRLDYSDSSCPSLLLEPQSTNLVTYSEDFNDSSWVKLAAGTGSAAIVTSDYAISPDGSQNASRLQCDLSGGNSSSSNQSLIYNSYSSSGNQTISIYAKSNNGQNQTIYFANTQTSGDTIIVTPQWQKFTFSHSTSTYIAAIGLRGRSGGAINDTADILIWGAQVEQQSYATSYIPTNGATATRLADVCNDAGTSDTFNDSEGVLMAEISALADDSSVREIALSDGSSSNRIELRYGTASNRIQLVARSGGVVQSSISNEGNNIILNNKVLVKYKSNDFSLWVNGFEVGTDTSGNTPIGLSELAFDDGNGGSDFYGNTKQLQYFNTALTDSEIEELTSWESFLEMAAGQNYTIK